MIRFFIVIFLVPLSVNVFAAGPLRILLTNDDGYEAPGIRALHQALTNAGHTVYLIAPAQQQSGAAASITSGGVRVTAHDGLIWAVHGRPADAVRVGLGEIMKNDPPDLVVSGANFGNNTGRDVNISGTVGAAVTALHLGFPSIAISVQIKLAEASTRFPSTVAAFPHAGDFLVRLIENLPALNDNSVININYPAVANGRVAGVKWAKLATHSILTTNYTLGEDGRWAPAYNTESETNARSDAALLASGYVTLTLLDGNMSVPPGRAHKKLAKQLK